MSTKNTTEDTSSSPSSVPIIDMSLPLNKLGSQIHQACSTVGFFVIVNHGVSEELRCKVLDEGRRMFRELSTEEKASIHVRHSDSYRGYQPIGVNITQDARDAHEALDLISESTKADRGVGALTMYGKNQWPDPCRLPELRPTMELYIKEMNRVGQKLVGAMACGLGIDPKFFDPYFDDAYWSMRVIRYPISSHSDDAYNYGVGEHTDYGVLTMILCDDYPGTLQIRRLKKNVTEKEEEEEKKQNMEENDDNWMNVNPIPGGFICNLGDMMARWSNNIYVATPHRVLRPQKLKGFDEEEQPKERMSVPFFFDPNYDSIVSPIDDLVRKSQQPPCFEPVMYGDHLLAKSSNNFSFE